MGLERKSDQAEITKDQLDGLAADKNGINARTLEEITKVSGSIKEKIKDAELKGILDTRVADQFRTRLDKNSTDKNALEKIGSEVDVVISFIRKLKDHKEIDKKTVVENEIKEFLAKSPSEQQKYEQGLAENLKVLDDLYQKVTKLTPAHLEEFRNLTKGKIEFVQKMLKQREKNKKDYLSRIEANSDLFSKESKEEWMKAFEELTNIEDQEKYINEFEKQVEAKKSVMKSFKAFPAEIQKKFEAKFANTRRKERIVILQDMERLLEEGALDILNKDENAKHFSEIERGAAMKTFKSKEIHERTEMFALLRGMLKYNAQMSQKYEKLPPEIKLEIQERMGFTNFYQLSFEDKMKSVETGEKLREPNAKIEGLYKEKLQKAVKENYMSEESAKLFLQKFEQRDSFGKAEWLAVFDTDQLAPRIQVTKDYQNAVMEKYPDDQGKQQQLLNVFYKFGLTERYEKLEAMLGTEVTKAVKSSTAQRSVKEVTDPRTGETPTKNETPNTTDSENSDDEGLNKYDIESAMERVKQGGLMQEKMKDQTIADELTDLAAKSENYNANTTDSRRKNKHLGSEFDRILNEKLQGHTDGEMVLDKEGQAEEIREVDIKNIGKNKQEVYQLKKEVVTHRGEKSKNVHNLQLNSRENGQIVNAKTGQIQAEKRKEQLQKELAERTAQALKAGGKKLTKKDADQLSKAASQDDMHVKLQDAA